MINKISYELGVLNLKLIHHYFTGSDLSKVWKQNGYTRIEILKMLNQSYKYYDTRIPKDESSVRRCLRNGEDLILSTSKGDF